MPARLGILLSGSGTTYANLAERCASGELPATIAGVVSSRADVAGVERARERGHALTIARDADAVSAALRDFGATHVAMCGWLRYWDPPAPWRETTVNIHPSLLPAFGGRGLYGARVHRAVLAAGCKLTGCSVHLVAGEYDSGPILAQRAVPVLPGDDDVTLAARVQAAERQLYPAAIAALIEGGLAGNGAQRWLPALTLGGA